MHLRTFGGLTLEPGAGEASAPELGRRRLALVAVLAAAGARGCTREKIIGILWPNADEEQARHTLSQTLYLMRRETGRTWAAGSTLLRLHESITSDVAQLQDALDTNQLERAATLYTGAFLDGFYLPGAPEFEEWVEATRARLHASAIKALEQLAKQADADRRFEESERWWRRLTELDPYSAANAAGRMRALVAAGDNASALQFAREYEARLRRELDAEPAPIIAELTAGIRAAEAVAGRGSSAPPLEPAPMRHEAAAVGAHRQLRSRRVVLAAAALFTLAVSAVFAAVLSDQRSAATSPYLRTRSAVAYALYEQGLRAKYAGDGPATYRLMKAALDRDSTFAMAAFQAYRYREYGPDQPGALLPVVTRLAATAPDRERLYIQGFLALGQAPQDEVVAIARELTRRYPDDPDGQFLLGEALAHSGDWPGSIAAFNRAVVIDSAAGAYHDVYCRLCGALHTMTHSYLWWDSVAAAERTARRLIVLRPNEASGWEATIEPLLRQGRRAEAEASIARARSLSPVLRNPVWLLDRDLIRAGRLEELEVRLVSELRSAAPDARGEAPWLLAFALRNQGRLQDADDFARNGVLPRIGTRLAGQRDDVSLAIIALERGHAREAAQLFFALLDRHRAGDTPRGLKARNTAWHMTLAATALASADDTAAVRALADSVERIGARSSNGRDLRLHHFLHGLLLQKQNRHADAVDAFRRALYSPTDGYTRINLELGRSLTALRRYPEAIAVLQPALRGGIDGSNTYVTHTVLHEALAHAFAGAGQRDSAAAHYRAVERAWRNADPQFAARYRTARAYAATN